MRNNHKFALHDFIRCVFGLLFAWLIAFQDSGACVQRSLHWVKDWFWNYELKKKNKDVGGSLLLLQLQQSSNQGVDIWNLKCASFISFYLLQLLAVSSDWTFSCFLFNTLNGTSGFLKDFYFEILSFFYAFIRNLKCLKNKVFLFKKKPGLCA